MADIFYTVLVIWVLWKIFGGTSKTRVFHHHNFNQPHRPEGEIKITSHKKNEKNLRDDDGEYVDYEEIK